jgi:hypothetical protein
MQKGLNGLKGRSPFASHPFCLFRPGEMAASSVQPQASIGYRGHSLFRSGRLMVFNAALFSNRENFLQRA